LYFKFEIHRHKISKRNKRRNAIDRLHGFLLIVSLLFITMNDAANDAANDDPSVISLGTPIGTRRRRVGSYSSGGGGAIGGGGGGGVSMAYQAMNRVSCNNCGKYGHLQNQCRMPIISTGIIVCRNVDKPEYLMICRKDSLGFVDFMRGKYSIYNKEYLLNMIRQMTAGEKERLRTWTFDALWEELWHGTILNKSPPISKESHPQYFRGSSVESQPAAASAASAATTKKRTFCSRRYEEDATRLRFDAIVKGCHSKYFGFYDLQTLLDESDNGCQESYLDPEWGFPKGRKNNKEKDLQCALREFEEETGYAAKDIRIVENMLPLEEIFMGSNYKSYKHKYYLACFVPSSAAKTEIHEDTTTVPPAMENKAETGGGTTIPEFQKSEVSKMAWGTYEECLQRIRWYNFEKRRLLSNVHTIISQNRWIFRCCS
jgi:8-oxo-dGTP pyrophosphatase MutT (NUDIX family)